MQDFETILQAVGLPASAAALDRAYDESGSYLSRIWARHRDVAVEEHVRAILTAVDAELPARVSDAVLAALVEAYARPILLVPPAPDTGARAAFDTLAARGCTLALVSNTMRTPGAMLRRLLGRLDLLGDRKSVV